MQNLHPPAPCSCTTRAPKGSQPHALCCAAPPSWPHTSPTPAQQDEATSQVKPGILHHSPARSRAGQSQEVMVENPHGKPKDKQLQAKQLQGVLHPHHPHIRDPGPERSLFSVSTWPVTASLQHAWASAGPGLTARVSQGRVPSPRQPKVCFLGWAGICARCYGARSRAVRGTEKRCFLQKYTHPLHLLTTFLYVL